MWENSIKVYNKDGEARESQKDQFILLKKKETELHPYSKLKFSDFNTESYLRTIKH